MRHITQSLRYTLLALVITLAGLTAAPARAQVHDPRYLLGTYLGGFESDYGRDVAVDAQGYIYVAGDTFSSTFRGYDLPNYGGRDVLVLKLHPDDKEILAGAVIGSPSDDEVIGMAVTPAGEVVLSIIAGGSWPLHNALVSQPLDWNNMVLVKFDANFNLVFSTYANATVGNTGGQNVALDSDGNIYLTGHRYENRSQDLIVQKYRPDGQKLLYQRIWRYVDDKTDKDGLGLDVGSDGSVYVTGTVKGYDSTFPVTAQAAQKLCGAQRAGGPNAYCERDAFIIILNPDGSTRYASYLGGQGWDEGVDIAVDGTGGTVVVGTTFSSDFPTTNGALLPRCKELNDACYYDTFVTRLHPDGSVAYSTYLNSDDSESFDFVTGVVADASGNATVIGFTAGTRFPVQEPLQERLITSTLCFIPGRFCYDGFITSFTPTGAVRFSTYLGGRGDEMPRALALGQDGSLYVTGSTTSANTFPTTPGAPQIITEGKEDFFLSHVRLDGEPPPPACPQTVAFDFDGDCHSDILWRQEMSGQ